MYVTDLTPITTSNRNQQIYQNLCQGLSLGLRRQIFFAACDNMVLRDRLSQQLEDELNLPSLDYPVVVTLDFNPEQPNFLSQIAQWLKQNQATMTQAITFQVIGIEQLTREPPLVQRRFLRCLQGIESYFPQFEANLLLWLPYPWYNSIRISVPEFWRWHTGLFEFWGDSTPVANVALPIPERSLEFYQQSSDYIPVKESLEEYFSSDLEDLPQLEELPEDELFFEENQVFIADFPPQITTVETPQEAVVTVAQTEDYLAENLINLGHYYRDLIASGDQSPENLILAIQSYQQGLQTLPENYPDFAEILNDLGNLYWMLGRYSQTPEEILPKLDLAIQSYQLGLLKLGQKTTSLIYPTIQNNLGAIYSELARYRDAAHSLSLSIQAYQNALKNPHLESDPFKYASTQNNLGTAFWHLAQHDDPISNLHGAIEAYQEALKQYNSEDQAMNWAMIQNNLGTAYWNLSQYDQPKIHLEKGIECYKKALLHRTENTVPAAHAATQNNLGTAYWHLTEQLKDSQEKVACLINSIHSYETAVSIAESFLNSQDNMSVNFDFTITLNNLGLVNYQVATEFYLNIEKTAKLTHLEGSLKAHLRSLALTNSEHSQYRTTFRYIINTVRAFYQEGGITGQNQAFSQIPGYLIPEILAKL
jgi:tetratricopeptide (TPR) repeat protein